MPTLAERLMPVASEHDVFAGLSPIDAWRLRQEAGAAGAANVTDTEKAANLRTNTEFALGLIPGPSNVLSGRDAFNSGAAAIQEAQGGNLWRALANAGLAGLSGVGAVTGLPLGRGAGGVARGATSTANAFPTPTPWVGWRHDAHADSLADDMARLRAEQPFDAAPFYKEMSDAPKTARADTAAIAEETARRRMEANAMRRYLEMSDPNRRVMTNYGWDRRLGLPEE